MGFETDVLGAFLFYKLRLNYVRHGSFIGTENSSQRNWRKGDLLDGFASV